MEIRFQNSPAEVKNMDTQLLRNNFLIQKLMTDDVITLMYSHYDRVIIGGVKPVSKTVSLANENELRAEYFLQRREMGIINVGGDGQIIADGQTFSVNKLDCLYLGKGTKSVSFKSADQNKTACFYILSAPAHQAYPTTLLKKENTISNTVGSLETSNHRTIYKYIHAEGIQSAQLVMGLTILEKGSVWNTMPAHTHTRRMEAYFYFDVPEDQVVFHLMGEPQQTRHIVVQNHEAVISPPWSIHSGCGTSNYGFIWGMAGENYTYTDMDAVSINALR
ncbi:MAG: 5-dehydro-4-deoxy-D-glucuronate isomerase [Sphingobacteriales bacterium 40-81]|nr:MAG: 5-dehydro-4-deoxy-D-glucuronate isomerase [Sphingobacteriales bacterium 40-81]